MNSPLHWSEASECWNDFRGVRIEPMFLNQGPVDARANNRTSSHPFFTWWWLSRGSVTLAVRGKKRKIGAGEWVLIPTGESRHQLFSDDAELTSLSFSATWPNRLPLFRLAHPVIQKADAEDALIRLARETHEAAGTARSSRYAPLTQRQLTYADCLRLVGSLHRFVADLLEQPLVRERALAAPGAGDARLDTVLDELAREVKAGPLPFAGWKRITGLGRQQLDRLARAHLGCSLREHRDKVLFTEIHRRLASDHSSIKLHAFELGFVDSAHFCRWVKCQSGLNPSQLALRQT